MIRGVLFDMDGVLLDTETIGRQAFVDICAELGYHLPMEAFARFLGCTREEDERLLREMFGADFPFDVLYEGYRSRVAAAVTSGRDVTKPGLDACMDGLRARGIRTALATSTSRASVEKYLPHVPAMQRLDAMVCGAEGGRSKPAPDIFLEAARRLGLAPEECIGVEDSVKGLMSLTAAGCVRVMIPDLVPCDQQVAHLVDYPLTSLQDLCALVDQLNGSGS